MPAGYAVDVTPRQSPGLTFRKQLIRGRFGPKLTAVSTARYAVGVAFVTSYDGACPAAELQS